MGWFHSGPYASRGRDQTPRLPRVNDRHVMNGILFILWTGCQWKAVDSDWFHDSSSTLHRRFQDW